jgi:3-phosphoshikimate 1-carboxyvinyltransferase
VSGASPRWRIVGGHALAGHVVPPADKSIAHRALFASAIAEGRSTIRPRPAGRDNHATARVLRALGVRIDDDGDGLVVHGVGTPRALERPEARTADGAAVLDCENSGTTMRVLAGLLAATPYTITLVGDASLSRRPMARLRALEPLGVRVQAAGGDVERLTPPIAITGAGHALRGGDVTLAIASAQVKTALLLAGLHAAGPVAVREPLVSRDHTERMWTTLGAELVRRADGAIVVSPLARPLRAHAHQVPPDPSSAAFWLAAALLVDAPGLTVSQLVNPTRTGFVRALERLGATIEVVNGDTPEAAPTARPWAGGEPVATLRARRGAPDPTRHTIIDGQATLDALDEVPILAAVAAFTPGVTELRDAGELRVKESDRLARTVEVVTAFGGAIEARGDALVVHGRAGRPRAATVDVGDDHRLALTAAVLALAADGESVLEGVDVADVSYPGWAATLASLGASIDVDGGA